MHTHTHTTVLLLFWNLSGTTRVSRYQKGKTRKVKTNLDLLEQEIVSGSGICWAICKSAPHPRRPRQHPTTQFFTGWMPFLPPNQQRQSTEGDNWYHSVYIVWWNLNYYCFYYYYYHFTAPGLCPGVFGWASTRKVKPIWITVARDCEGKSISWAICRFATRPEDNNASIPPLKLLILYWLNLFVLINVDCNW